MKNRQKNDDREIFCDIDQDERFAEEDNAWRIKEERNNRINELMKYLSERLNEVFPPAEADIFLIYYRLKSEKAGVSYQKMAKITNRSFSEISQIIQKIKAFVKNDEEIINKKKELLK